MDYGKTLNLPKTAFPMRGNLTQREPQILNFWEKENIYMKIQELRANSPRFILHDGPPYANGNIHLGQAFNKILKDVIVKYKTMSGYSCPFIPGWDCHGLPVEYQLLKELGVKKSDVPVLEFRKRAREYALRFVKKQRAQFQRLGVFGRWEKPYLTMDYTYESEIIKSFGELANKGYICRRLKPIYWCIDCQTALAEAEIEYKLKESPSIYVKFQLCKDNFPVHFTGHLYILIWTTTPWTLPANLAVAVHPDLQYVLVQAESKNEAQSEAFVVARDSLKNIQEAHSDEGRAVSEQWKIIGHFSGKELQGLKYVRPFSHENGQILLADFVDPEEGTGCVHIAPGHGQEDYFLALKNDLPIFSPIDDAGKFTDLVDTFQGIQVFKANNLIQEDLKQRGVLFKQASLQHSYPHCWRCGKPVIFRATPQWFLLVDEHNLRERALKAVSDDIHWIPAFAESRMKSMLRERPDWCLSRQRIWGVSIPVLYCNTCKNPIVDERVIQLVAERVLHAGSDVWFEKEVEFFVPPGFKCPNCSGETLRKEQDILDVWFESGVSHAAVLAREPELEEPADLYLEGSDQHRGWFQTSLLTSLGLKDNPPYKSVLTHGFVVDANGKKMSKSLGNVVDPQEIVQKYGAEILRLWSALQDYSEDIRISEEILKYTIELYRKIRNSFRFLLGNLFDFSPQADNVGTNDLREVDRWIVSRLENLVQKITSDYERFKFHEVIQQQHYFINNYLSAFYFDILKDRLYTYAPNSLPRRAAQSTLYTLLVMLTKLMAPVLPFTAEEVWGYATSMGKEKEMSVFLANLPRANLNLIDIELEAKWEKVMQVRNEVLKELEKARQTEKISSSLDARLVIQSTDDTLAILRDLGETALKEIFIVSQVKLEDAPINCSISIEKASGKKCPRCWNYSEKVGENIEYPSLCERCWQVVAEIDSDGKPV